MLSDFFVKIEDHFVQGLPFVVYRKPNEDRISVVFQKDNELRYVLDYKETGFVFAPFDSSNPAILIQPDEIHHIIQELSKDPGNNLSQFPKTTVAQKASHIDLVTKGIAEIHKGTFKKVVLSRKLEVVHEKKPLEVFHELLAFYAEAFCYLWYHPKVGMWAGATPETLLEIENKKMTTMSLAGTLAFSEKEPPLWGRKELEEQQVVTTYITNTLEDKILNLKVSDMESVRAGNLWHLRTSVSGTLKDHGLQDTLNALHPTPAICGFPKSAAKDFILHNENYDREYYTGFLGELNFKKNVNRSRGIRNQENSVYRAIKNTSHLFVNLRCVRLIKKKAIIYVGGGITKDSVPEKEWQETRDKSITMFRVLRKDNN
ncbi:MAG: chorismate-binding protein [Saonia sp.]